MDGCLESQTPSALLPANLSPAKQGGKTGTMFNILILVTLCVPFLIYFFQTFFASSQMWSFFVFLIPLIGGIAGTHTFSTIYLFFDPELSIGISHKWIKLFFMPLGIIFMNMFAVTIMSFPTLLWFMVFFVHYAMFHFGRQNMGVLAFSLLSTSRKVLVPAEKNIINGVTFCGMLGALNLFMPALLLDPKRWPLDVSFLEPVATLFYSLGMGGYALVLIYAVIHFVKNRERFGMLAIPIYWMCVFWYLPIYVLSDYPLLSLALFTTAHGLQYLVFLGFHSYSLSRNRWVSLIAGYQSRQIERSPMISLPLAVLPTIFLICVMGTGWWIWNNSATLFVSTRFLIDAVVAHEGVIKTGTGFILGLTMAHYWIDQHIWKFKNSERRKWLQERYPFLVS